MYIHLNNLQSFCGYVVLLSIVEAKPNLKNYKRTFVVILTTICMIIDLLFHVTSTNESLHYIRTYETWFLQHLSVSLSFFLLVAIIFFYSVSRLFNDIYFMTKKKTSDKWKIAVHSSFCIIVAILLYTFPVYIKQLNQLSSLTCVLYYLVLFGPVIINITVTSARTILTTGTFRINCVNKEWDSHDDDFKKSRTLFEPKRWAYTEDQCFHFCLKDNQEIEYSNDRNVAIQNLQLAKLELDKKLF